LITSSLSLGLLLSAFGAAIVGSLIAASVANLIDISVDIHASVADINSVPLTDIGEDHQDEAEAVSGEDEEVAVTEVSVKPHRGRGKNNLFKNQRRRYKKNLRKKNKV